MKYFLVQRGFALRWFCIFWICMILEYLHTDKPAFGTGRLGVCCSAMAAWFSALQFQIRNIIDMSMGNALAPNRSNSLPCPVWTSRQRSCNQTVGCLLCSMAKIYDLWYRSFDKHKVCGLFPFGKYGFSSSSTAKRHRYIQWE